MPEPTADAEVIALLVALLRGARHPARAACACSLNSMGDETCRPAYREKVAAFIREHADELCEECNRRADTNPLRAFDCKNPACVEVMAERAAAARRAVRRLRRALRGGEAATSTTSASPTRRTRRSCAGSTTTRAPSSRCRPTRVSARRTRIGGGGRYDRLMEEYGGPPTPGLGFALGFERTLLAHGGRGRRDPGAAASPRSTSRAWTSRCAGEVVRARAGAARRGRRRRDGPPGPQLKAPVQAGRPARRALRRRRRARRARRRRGHAARHGTRKERDAASHARGRSPGAGRRARLRHVLSARRHRLALAYASQRRHATRTRLEEGRTHARRPLLDAHATSAARCAPTDVGETRHARRLGRTSAATTADSSSSTCATARGIVQCTFDPDDVGRGVRHRRAGPARVGRRARRARSATAPRAPRTRTCPPARSRSSSREAEVLNRSETPPFEIEAGIETDELTRLRWRYLDIRRPEVLRGARAARPRHAALPQVARAPRLHGGRDADPRRSRRPRARATSSSRAA